MAGPEGVPVGTQGEHADAEHGGDALSGQASAFETVAQVCVDRAQVVVELTAERCQAYLAAVGAVELRARIRR